MSLFVKYVASNIKGGISCNLGEKTVIIGPNGSGKSAVVQSIELAIAGFASDIAGREDVRKPTELIALAPGREGELFARAVLSNGEEAKWIAGAKGAKKPVHTVPPSVIPDRVFPLFPVRDAVRGNPDTARKFFLTYALPNLTADDVLERIPKSLHKLYHDAILSSKVTDPIVDKLLLALEYATKKARDASAASKGQESLSGVVSDGLQPLPTEDTVNALKTEQKAAQKQVADMEQALGAVQAVAKLRTDAEAVRNELSQAQQNCHTLRSALDQIELQLNSTPAPAALDDHNQRVIAIIEKLATLEATMNAPQSCPVCRTDTAFGTFQQRYASARAFLDQQSALVGPRQMLMDQKTQRQADLTAWSVRAATLNTTLEALLRNIGGASTPVPQDDQLALARERLAKANAAITNVETIKAQWDQARKAKEAASATGKEEAQWAELRDACADAISKLLDAGVQRFVAKVQDFLPPDDLFALKLHENKKQVFRLGLQRKDVLHTALSGAEWARVMGAIAGACTEDGKLSILVPEERAFDSLSLHNTLAALAKVPGQIIIAAPNWPAVVGPDGAWRREVPAGWTVIDTTTGMHRTSQYAA